jgi:signal transduction histidine kinase
VVRRFVIAFLGLTVLILLILVVPLGISTADRERDRLTLGLERDARVIGAFAEDTLQALPGQEAEDLQAAADDYAAKTGARVVIVGAQGGIRADSDPVEGASNYRARPEIADALAGQVASGTRHSDLLDTDLLYVAVPVASGGEIHGAVRLTYPTTEVDRRVRKAWLTLAGISAVSLAAAGVVAFSLARSVLRPLRELQRGATSLGEGDLTTHVADDDGPPEVRALARAFNDTSRRLEALIDAQDAFVADASHQLRTPLTALRLRLENLEPALDGEDATELHAALDESARLSRVVDGLLALARADRSSTTATTEPVDIGASLADRRDAWAPIAADRSITIVADVPAGVTGCATPDRLVQVLDNLVDNAIEASPEGSTIRLWAQPTPTGPVLHVEDEGPGLTADQRARAFDRFWQGPTGTGSSGLGLAIVRKLVQADGGSVELGSAAGGGLDAVIRLPPVPAGPTGPPVSSG